ncbi:MAG: hypothetical protein A2139_04555 [Desulfobacca sp. RBG_16_60_12]|nr:MAG: hypothetical protein A2139_04555 [Desulfobacca sp. RBG_16_60_12]
MNLYGDEKLGSLYQMTWGAGKASRAKDGMRQLIPPLGGIHVTFKSADKNRRGGAGKAAAGRPRPRYTGRLKAMAGGPKSEQAHGHEAYSG